MNAIYESWSNLRVVDVSHNPNTLKLAANLKKHAQYEYFLWVVDSSTTHR